MTRQHKLVTSVFRSLFHTCLDEMGIVASRSVHTHISNAIWKTGNTEEGNTRG